MVCSGVIQEQPASYPAEIKFAITVQAADNIDSVRGATGHGWCKRFFHLLRRESEKRSAIMLSSRLDFSRPCLGVVEQAERVDAH